MDGGRRQSSGRSVEQAAESFKKVGERSTNRLPRWGRGVYGATAGASKGRAEAGLATLRDALRMSTTTGELLERQAGAGAATTL